ncbi:YhdP family protein [Mesorhizobium sp. 1B3]|uniref:YhdP family protein n=1 Tax=Mesorhizobium sp. 1B3 TaxID=3243599 RepID=UPI003D965A17
MEHELPRHEKVKFRREDIAELHTLPSAIGQDLWKTKRSLHRRALGACAGLVTVATSIALLLGLLLYFVGISGVSTDSVRDQAEAAVEKLLGVDVAATLGPARISFDSSRFIAVEVNDVRLATTGSSPTDVVTAKSIRFGIRALPLVTGQIKLGSARVEDARIFIGALPAREDIVWTASLTGEDGLVDPDLVAHAVFAAVHRLFDAFNVGSTRSAQLENVEIVLAEGSALRSIMINHATLGQSLTGRLSFSAETVVDGREIAIKGTAARDEASRRIGGLDLSVSSSPLAAAAQPAAGAPTDPARETSIGEVDLKISGNEGAEGKVSRLAISLDMGDSVIRIDPRNDLDISMAVVAELVTGTGKLEIKESRIVSGRSRFDFNGAVGPRPRSDPTEAPAYRYELVSNQATLAPPDSPEPALDLVGRLAGTFDPVSARLEIDELGVRTTGGEVFGKAAVDFVSGKAPGVSLALSLPGLPTSHVKQIWPWTAAGGARRWALNNLFGGQVADGHIAFRVPPGRLGNGIPLTGDEISGHFKVTGTRFDVTGRIPPVRDAAGTIDFRGNDVDIALSSGTVYLPSGRAVAASDGTLTIRKANLPKVIGALDMDITGDAQAVTELASYEPINAMRHIGMTADEFSGQVSGNVKADIPLSKAAQGEKLNWLVALDFKDLAVTRPFEGQLATEADGTIVVDPTKAVIEAKAKLNGAPAEIDLVEPIGGSPVERQRKVAIVLDNKAREKIAPGLATLLDGSVKVQFDAGGEGSERRMQMDLTNAKLDLPWIGWSKGPGIAATASFRMATTDKTTTLSDFRLEGKSFAVAGNIVLAGGELSSARFGTVSLNRGDDVNVAIKRAGKGYAVDVSGASLDVRSLIKQVTSEKAGSSKASGAMTVTVDADVKALTGFHGERLSKVKLEYTGTGDRVVGLDVSAVTDAGSKVTVIGATERGRRTLEMRSTDAGSVLRFLDLYPHMEGGTIRLALTGDGDGPMRGHVDASSFWIVNEPKLASIVATTPPGDQRSLNQAVRSDIDTSRVHFERGFAAIQKAPGSLLLDRGVLRGPLIGLIFKGTLYDQAGNMNMTGTFMPAYGLNRIFGEIPLFGQILGNGRDRGLIGVTFRLAGEASSPALQINPLSAIAPGIFRSIFEFR